MATLSLSLSLLLAPYLSTGSAQQQLITDTRVLTSSHGYLVISFLVSHSLVIQHTHLRSVKCIVMMRPL
jgi:hypothetical protein